MNNHIRWPLMSNNLSRDDLNSVIKLLVSPMGAMMTYQAIVSKFFKPSASLTVGVSGAIKKRLLEPSPRIRILPARC